MGNLKEELYSGYLETLSPKLLRILELFALVREVLENKENLFISKVQLSTELFQDSWPKEETSHTDLESEENLSTVKNSQMRISK